MISLTILNLFVIFVCVQLYQSVRREMKSRRKVKSRLLTLNIYFMARSYLSTEQKMDAGLMKLF